MDIITNGTAAGTIYYEYDPSPAAAVIFIAAFGLGLVAHFIAMIIFKTFYFIPLLIGCIMDCFGYYGRYWSSQNKHEFGAWILQGFLLILAPILLSATVYVALSRLVGTAEQRKPSRWRSAFFILVDVICFVIQLAALGMQATTSESLHVVGRTVLIVGLSFQCVVTIIFIISTWRVFAQTSNRVADQPLGQWKRYIYTLAFVGVLLLIRNIFRTAEYAEGATGSIAQSEAYIYVLDGLPMLSLVVALFVYHPGRLQRLLNKSRGGSGQEFLDKDDIRRAAEVPRLDVFRKS